MEYIFQYNSAEYWEKSNKKWLWLFRVIGIGYVTAGAMYFLNGWHGERDTWNLSLALFYLIGGMFMFYRPKRFHGKNSLGV